MFMVLRVRRTAEYRDICVFGELAGKAMCETEEHTGLAPLTKLRFLCVNGYSELEELLSIMDRSFESTRNVQNVWVLVSFYKICINYYY